MLPMVRRPQLRSPPHNCVDTTRTATRALRPRYDERPPAAACACGSTSWPAAPGPPPVSSLPPFLLPAGGARSATLPVPFRSSVLLQAAQHSEAYPPGLPFLPFPESTNFPRRNSRLRAQPADPPAAGALAAENPAPAAARRLEPAPRDRAAARFPADFCPRVDRLGGGGGGEIDRRLQCVGA